MLLHFFAGTVEYPPKERTLTTVSNRVVPRKKLSSLSGGGSFFI